MDIGRAPGFSRGNLVPWHTIPHTIVRPLHARRLSSRHFGRAPSLPTLKESRAAAMDATDPLQLARAQFGLNIAFHILFPSITIGLAWILVYFRARYERTRDPAWLDTYKLWVKVFALTFAMGVVTGITM